MTKARLLWLAAAAVVAAGVVAGGFVQRSYEQFGAPGPLQKAETIVVERGASLRGIADQLAEAGVIDSPYLFSFLAWYEGAQHGLRAGEYAFDAGVSKRDVLDKLRRGVTVVHRVTLAEGLTSQEMMKVLEETDLLAGTSSAEAPLEGSLLPDTYHFSRGDTRDDIVDRMTRAMDVVLKELWAGRAVDLPLATPQEAVILASIVEKETAVPEERPRVAAVFINRLRKGMRLESDPTVVYGLTGGAGPLGRKLLRADLRKQHPYNTYRNFGLPPGPIANPGRDSLAAVLNPLETDEFFFVADGTGGHVFARTLAEHNRNVARWRKIQRAKRQKKN
ncbi:MAG: endolytic transglycosylase MltG [Pseudomonadota bacterium]